MEFWVEFPPVFQLVRAFVGYEPSSRPQGRHSKSSNRRGGSQSSDEYEKAMFVSQWGGQVLHPDSLPLAVQGALAEIAKLEAAKQQNAK